MLAFNIKQLVRRTSRQVSFCVFGKGLNGIPSFEWLFNKQLTGGSLIKRLQWSVGGGATPTPHEPGWGHGGTPWRTNSRATLQGLDQMSKMEG